jgi:hypothetical protein
MLQQHDGRMPATVRPTTVGTTTAETFAPGPPPKKKHRCQQQHGQGQEKWTPLTVWSTTEETPARSIICQAAALR